MEPNFVVYLALGSFFGLANICTLCKVSLLNFCQTWNSTRLKQFKIVINRNHLPCIKNRTLFFCPVWNVPFRTQCFWRCCFWVNEMYYTVQKFVSKWWKLLHRLHIDVPYHFHYLWIILRKKIVVLKKTDFFMSRLEHSIFIFLWAGSGSQL